VIGVSGRRERPEDAREARAEAEAAAALARPAEAAPATGARSPIGAQLVRWDRLGAYQLLAPLAGAALPAPLQRLLDHPDAEPLVATLEAYLDHAGDAQATAAALFIHRTTLYHRLRRIAAISGADLRDGDDRLALHVGLRIWRLRR
jgi:sugar diacid utilization regulator